MAYPYYQQHQLHHMGPPIHHVEASNYHKRLPEKQLMRASSAPYYSSSSGGGDNLQDYMKNLSRGEFVMGGTKPALRPTLSMAPSTSTGRRDEMVAGNSYVYQKMRKVSRPSSNQDHHSSSSSRVYHPASQSETPSSHSGQERMRRRSVSPQMQRKQIVSPPSSLPTIESQSGHQSSTSRPLSPRKKNPRKKIDMKLIDNRMRTYEREPRWTLDGVDYYPIASAGLYYTGQEDITKCCECEITLCDWSAHDDPLEVHFDKSPNCIFLRREMARAVEDLCCSKFRVYKDLAERIKSFHTYPHTINVKGIASNGFFYTGVSSKTQCFACGFVKSNWSADEDPIAIHRNFYKSCPHLKEMEVDSDRMLHSSAHSEREGHVSSSEATALKKPDYSSVSVRLLSFKHYSSHIDKEDFVDAGFFLLSPPQTVKCFACNLVMETWLPGDNPLKKHYRFNPSCPFLQGKDIVSPSPPPDSYSFPAPIYSYDEMVDKFKGFSVANGHTALPAATETKQDENIKAKEKDEIKTSTGKDRELFNLPIHLPPKYKLRGATSSSPPYNTYPSTESSTPGTPPDETFRSLNEDDKLCIICFDKPKEYAIIPCGHLCTCADCSDKLRNCPVCRRPKQNVIRIFNT